MTKRLAPRVLLFDIETAPILGYVWRLWDQSVAINQIESDWHLLSWAAMWLDADDDQVIYMDQRFAKDIEDDRELLKPIWKLLDQAEIVITHNGKKFDARKINARFVLQGFKPPSSYRHIDTKQLAQKHFDFTSNKLEYLTEKLCPKYKKLKHGKFPGFDLWRECMNGNIEAWEEMERYNKRDVLGLREVYRKLSPWDTSINFGIYYGEHVCKCGSRELKKQGWYYTNTQKYQRYRCKMCGAEFRDRTTAISTKESRKLPTGTDRSPR